MSVIWNFLRELYSDIDEGIRDIGNDFVRAVAFIFMWVFMITIILIVILLSIFLTFWVGLIIIIAILIFEILNWIGRGLAKPNLSVSVHSKR